MYNKSILGLVADPSNIILCYTKPIAVGGKAPPNIAEHFTNIEALLERAQILQEQGRNLYFTPATFTSKSRTKAAAKGAHAVWFDIDIRDDKGYSTAQDAMDGIKKLLQTFKLPTPTIISTGGGYHLYWTCDEQLFPVAWNQCAKALHAMVKSIGGNLASDTARITDIASMMRLPGFKNVTRGGAVATVVHKAASIPKAQFYEMFDPTKVAANTPLSGGFSISARPAHLGGSQAASAPVAMTSTGFNIASRPAHLGGSQAASAPVATTSTGFNIAARPAHLGGSATVSAPAAMASSGFDIAAAPPFLGTPAVRSVAPPSTMPVIKKKVVLANPISDSTKNGTYPQLLVQCALIRHMAENPNSVTEPEWKYAINVLMQTADGRSAVHEFSSGYAEYNAEETNAKIEQAAAFDRPVSCSTLRGVSANAFVCDGCALKNAQVSPVKGISKIAIPEAVSSETSVVKAKAVIELSRASVETEEVRKAANKTSSLPSWSTIPLSPLTGRPDPSIVPPIPPKGFTYGHLALGRAGVYDASNVAEPIMDALIWADRELKLIDSCGIRHVGYRFQHINNRGDKEVLYIESSKMQQKEMANWMVGMGIVPEFTQDMYRYIVGSVHQVYRASAVPPIYVVDSFGWVEMGDRLCFVTPASVITSDGSEMEVVTRNGVSYTPVLRGVNASAEGWAASYSMCNPADAYHAHFSMLCSLASSLYYVVSQHGDNVGGMTMVLCGETGMGKSFLQNAMQSVWQSPESMSGSSTFNALPKLASIARHLLCAVDDLTMIENEKHKQLYQFVLTYPQGREKSRADSRNALHKGGSWKNLICITSNLDIGGIIRENDNQGGADARILEMFIRHRNRDANPIAEEAGRRGMFTEHCGTLGAEFARRIIGAGTRTIADMCSNQLNEIKESVGDPKRDNAARIAAEYAARTGTPIVESKRSSVESNRFRLQLIALAATAGVIMRDVLPFDVGDTIQWAVDSATIGAFADSVHTEVNPDRKARVNRVLYELINNNAHDTFMMHAKDLTDKSGGLETKMFTKRSEARDHNDRIMSRLRKPIGFIRAYDAYGIADNFFISKAEFLKWGASRGVGIMTLNDTMPPPEDGLPRSRFVNISPLIGDPDANIKMEMIYVSKNEYDSFTS